MFQQFYTGSDLLIWPLVGLGLFVLGFVAVLLYVGIVLRGSPVIEHLAALPLADDTTGPVDGDEEASGDE
jgi:hypothetical protein